MHFLHLLLEENIYFCARESCQEGFGTREQLEGHAERCLSQNPVTNQELESFMHQYMPHVFVDLFYYNLPLIYQLAEFTSVDQWWYSLDLQDFLNENDFGGGQDIFM